MPYKDPEKKRAKDSEYSKRRSRNMKLCLKYMKDRNRPKFKTSKGDTVTVGGLTPKEIDMWCERVSKIRTALLAGVFKPQVRRWRDGI